MTMNLDETKPRMFFITRFSKIGYLLYNNTDGQNIEVEKKLFFLQISALIS